LDIKTGFLIFSTAYLVFFFLYVFIACAREDGRVKYALTQKGLEALETLQEIVEAFLPKGG